MKRDFTNFDELKYLNDIENLDFSLTTNGEQNLDSCFTAFQDSITNIMEKHAPIKTLSKQQRKQQRKPWITNGILKLISIKNKLYKKFLKSKDTFWYQRYKCYRDMLNHLIRRSKRNHYRSYFETFKNNSKEIWKGVNELINKTNSKSSKNIHLKDNGSTITDQKKVADRFNKYFTGIAQSLVNKLGKTKSKFTDYLKEPNVNSIFINPVNESEVFDQLDSLI